MTRQDSPPEITPAMIQAGLDAINRGIEKKDMVVAIYLAMQEAMDLQEPT